MSNIQFIWSVIIIVNEKILWDSYKTTLFFLQYCVSVIFLNFPFLLDNNLDRYHRFPIQSFHSQFDLNQNVQHSFT